MTSERTTPAVRDLDDRIAGLSPEKRELLARLLAREERGSSARGGEPGAGRGALSFGQRRLWFLDQLEPDTASFNISTGLVLEGAIVAPALSRSFALVVERHEVLRTAFLEERGVPVARVVPVPAPESLLERHEPAGATEEERRRAAEAHLRERAALPFDLSEGRLLRACLVTLSPSKHLLGLTVHHIAFDAWSVGILYSELFTAYEAFSRGEEPKLTELSVSYQELMSREAERLSGPELERQVDYWLERLEDLPREVGLPADRSRGERAAPVAAREGTVLPSALVDRVRELGRGEGASLFMTLLAAFELLLHRHTGREDVVVGTPISGRHRPEARPLIGFFVNNLVLRARVSESLTFRELLTRARDLSKEAFAHQEVPFEKLVETLRPDRALNRNPLFQVVFTLQPALAPSAAALSLEIEPLRIGAEAVRYDVEFYAQESADGLRVWCLYDETLFEPETIAGLVDDYRWLLERVVEAPDQRLSELNLLTARDSDALSRWNDTARPYPSDASLSDLFARAVTEHRDAVAVELDGSTMTYGELERASGRLARRLRDRGIGPESTVGLCLDRTPATVVAMVAVLRAGGAYVPLDADYPAARLAFMMKDAGVALVLTEERFLERLPRGSEATAELLCLDREIDRSDTDAPPDPPESRRGPDSLAYVMFTSGSTGMPKGVEVTDQAIARLLFGIDYVSLGPNERVLALAPLAFDASTFEIWGALLHGGRLVMFPDRVPSASALAAVVRDEKVTTLWLTGALFNAVVDEDPGALSGCRQVLAGGEALSVSHVRRAQTSCPETRFINGYGPTEGTTFTCCYPIPGVVSDEIRSIPIGPPISNTMVRVLDESLSPVPVGAPGELYIGGAGLARGYRRREALTAERFLPDPAGAPGSRMYRTGDRVRFRRDGALLFLGRMDDQVKLRGFRVEPGEVEAALRDNPDVRDAAVVVRDLPSGDRQLVGYWVRSAGSDLDGRGLRARLLDRLPDYMMPGRLVRLEALPLTASGKLDRRALPDLSETSEAGSASASFVAPRGPVEAAVVEIFQDILSLDRAVGVEEDFFELGGHSLLATQLVSRIRETFGVELPLRAMFEGPTAAALSDRVESTRGGSPSAKALPLERVSREETLPLTYSQHRLWFLEELLPGSSAYNVAGALRFHGELSVDVLARALAAVVERHESLRTAFETHEGKAVLRILPGSPRRALPVVDLSTVDAAEREAFAERLASANAVKPFELKRGDVFRTSLLRLAADDHVLLVAIHHIVSDAWSLGVLVRELGAFYRAFAAGEAAPFPDLPFQVADYAAWQRRQLSGPLLDEELRFWRDALKGLSSLELPTDRPRPPVPTFRGARRTAHLPKTLTSRVEAAGRSCGATPFMTLLAAFQALLSRLTGQKDIVVGTPIANRRRREVEALIGFFANNLVMRADVSDDPTFEALVGRVREWALDAYDHQDVPFDKLVDELSPDRDLSRNPLFQVTFSLQTATVEKLELPGLTLGRLPSEARRTRFDLELNLFRQADGMSVVAFYNTDLFDASTIDRLLGQYRLVLESVGATPDRRVSELPLLTAEERAGAIEAWSRTTSPATELSLTTLHERFEEVARRDGDAVALVEPGALEWTYAELDRVSSLWAHRLQSLGAGPGARVGICLERSAQLVVAILAVVKTGAAYVPLDPSYPEERLRYLIEDAAPTVVLTDGAIAGYTYSRASEARVPSDAPLSIRFDVSDDSSKAKADTEVSADTAAWVRPSLEPDDAAYVIYTSGSTGRPKGVTVTHGNVLRLMDSTDTWFGFGPDDAVALFHSFAFDFSVWEIWAALLYGARLVVVPYWVSRSPEALVALAREERLTVLNQTPSAFRQFANAEAEAEAQAKARAGTKRAGASGEKPLALRAIVFGGEALPLETLRPWMERHGDERPQLINMYGITETTVHVTYRRIRQRDLEASWRSVIGRPLPDLTLYLLDESLEPVPPGVAGEIFVGGAGVARGYLNRPGLTAERFLPDPYGSPGARLYRSGDLARYRNDGELEYVGRRDHQVKLRGFRIELGEIEAACVSHPSVREAAVLIDTMETAAVEGHQRLVACVVASASHPLDESDLKRHLRERLPEYMVPAAVVVLDRLPVTAHGKLDLEAVRERARLRPREPEAPQEAAAGERTAPRTEAEKVLAGIWSEMLGIADVRSEDNFFELGGDSILSIQVVSMANDRGLVLSARDVFQHQTLGALAEAARASQPGIVEEHEEDEPAGADPRPVPLSPIQRWFFDADLVDPHHYNQSILLELLSSQTSPGVVAKALDAIVQRHDVFRLRFRRRDDGKWTQELTGGASTAASVTRVDLSDLTEADGIHALERASDLAQTSLDLAAGPLARFVHFELAEGAAPRLLLALHHVTVDGVSWRILLDELHRVLSTLERGPSVKSAGSGSGSGAVRTVLGRKTTSYRRWAERLAWHQVEQASDIASRAMYWRDQVSPPTPLPRDVRGGKNLESGLAHVRVALDEERTQKLLKELPRIYRTHIDEVLLTALAVALGSWTGEETVVVDLEGHGRETVLEDVDLSRTVGWFTCIYPVRLPSPRGAGVVETLRSVKDALRAVPDKGMGYGLLRGAVGPAGSDDPPKSESESTPDSEPETSFNYLGQMDAAFAVSDRFRIARERVGRLHSGGARRRHLLDVSAVVASGRLQMDWIFASEIHRRDTIERVAQCYLEALDGLLEASESETTEVEPLSSSDVDLVSLDARTLEKLAERAGGDSVIEDVHPLSPLQQGMLFHGRYAPDSRDYLVQVGWKLSGPLQPDAFERAWGDVVGRHTILRTSFDWDSGEEPLGVVHRAAAVAVPFVLVDWSLPGDVPTDVAAAVEAFHLRDRSTPLDLSRAPLLRVSLVKVDERTHYFLWTFHHLLLDGWSFGHVLREVFTCYEARCSGRLTDGSGALEVEALLGPARPFRDYIAWLVRQEPTKSESFWRETLKGLEGPTPLGLEDGGGGDVTGPGGSAGSSHEECSLSLSGPLSEALRGLSRARKLTLSTIFQGLWAFLSSRYSGENDVVFGSTVSGRPADLPGVDSIIGLFINTLPARVVVRDDARLADWLAEIQQSQAEAREHAHTPLVEIQKFSDVPRGTPLFESIFVFENFPADRRVSDDGRDAPLRAGGFRFWTQTNYPVHFRVRPGQEIVLDLTYDRARLSSTAASRLLGHFQNVLEAAVANPDRSLNSLLTPEPDVPRSSPLWSLSEWDDAEALEHPLPLVRRLEAVVEARGDAPAVVSEAHRFTYRTLDREARAVARRLAEAAAPGERVLLLFGHGTPMVAAMLGALRCGLAYVPLDPRYPVERLRYIVEDSRASVLVTDEAHEKLAGELVSDRLSILLHRVAPSDETSGPATDLEGSLDPAGWTPSAGESNLAYLLYTSGSTGKPKGTMQSQRNVLGHVRNYSGSLGLGPGDRLTLLSSYGFDASVMSIWGGLASGASVHPYDLRDRGLGGLAAWVESEGITVFHSTPTVFRYFLDTLEDDRVLSSVRAVVLGGEEVTREDVARYRKHFRRGSVLVNGLGPTESTVGLQYFIDHDTPLTGRRVPVGYAVPGIDVSLVDESGMPAPILGEIALTGAQVALGYWGRPEETAAVFEAVPADLAGSLPERRTYRTGDLGRRRADGAIEFLGRKGSRVKIRGHRVELGEIESVLARAPGVGECAVELVMADQGEPRLVGYVVPSLSASESDLDDAALRAAARRELPDYMVPSVLIHLDALPLTPTGKIDRLRLPAPDASMVGHASAVFVAPRTPIEQELAEIWQSVLKREAIGVTDNFFDLGGHSLLATRVVTRIHEAFAVELPLRWLFERPTVEELAMGILERLLETESDLLEGERDGGLLSAAEETA